MDDSFIARMGYDPVRIFARIHGQAPTGIARLGSPKAEPAPAEPPPEVQADEEDPPPDAVVEDVAQELPSEALAVDGGVSPPDAAAEADSLPADAPRSRREEEAESLRLVREWLGEHWNAVEALARAGEAPRLPPLSAQEPAGDDPVGDAGDVASPQLPAEPPEPPYVEPEDRWTKWKMAQFLRQLAATHSVAESARKVGMSRQSAYRLRSRLKGQPFDVAWEAAFRHGYDDLAHAALELALEGEEVPHYYQGELVATHRKHNPQLIVQLLKMRNSAGAPMLGRYGAAAEFWSESWERMTQRIETGSVTWRDEQAALGPDERAGLALPDARQEVERIIARNLPDQPAPGRSRA